MIPNCFKTGIKIKFAFQFHEFLDEIRLSSAARNVDHIGPRGEKDIDARCKALVKANELKPEKIIELTKKISALIKLTIMRDRFIQIFGQNPDQLLQETAQRIKNKESTFEEELNKINANINSKIRNGLIDKEKLDEIQRLKGMIGDLILLSVTKMEHKTILIEHDHLKKGEQVRNDIDEIIDTARENDLNEVLQKVARYIYARLDGENTCDEVSISYVNADNDYLEFDHLTKVNPDTKDAENYDTVELSRSDFPGTFFASDSKTKDYDPQRKTQHVSLKIGSQLLGILSIKFKEEDKRLNDNEEELIDQATRVIDSYLDSSLKNIRLSKLRSQLTRIRDRAGIKIEKEGTAEKGFENGIIEQLKLLCAKTGTTNIGLELDVSGDGESYQIEMLVNKKGKIDTKLKEKLADKFIVKSKDIQIPHGSHIDDSSTTKVDGKIVFYGNNLGAEEKEAQNLAAEQIITAVRNWRIAYENIVKFGLPPNIALLYMRGILQKKSVEDMSMGFNDIKGFTAISEKIKELTLKYKLPEDYMIRLAASYEQIGKEIAIKFGGCFDKLVGDCLIINAGPPYTTEGKDGLNLTPENQKPEYHAMRSLFIAMEINKAMPKVQETFEELLREMAQKIDPANSDLNDFCQTHDIKTELHVTQGISSGETSIGLVEEEGKKTYCTSYTAIGDAMNLAARLQGNAEPGEIIISANTKELVEKGLKMPIIINDKGKNISWEEYKKSYLGNDYDAYDLIPIFEETLLDLKNKGGYEMAYRLRFAKVHREKVSLKKNMTEQELKKLDGYYNRIHFETSGDEIDLTLQSSEYPDQYIETALKNPKIEKRYVPEKDYDKRKKDKSDNIVRVKNGTITVIEYLSIENLINQSLEKLHNPVKIFSPEQIPHGIYKIRNKTEIEGSDTLIFDLEKNGITFKVKINKKTLRELTEIKDLQNAKRIYDMHKYTFDKIEQETNLALTEIEGYKSTLTKPDSGVMFIHASGEFLGKI